MLLYANVLVLNLALAIAQTNADTESTGIASLPEGCGRYSTKISRISGGYPAKKGQFPAYVYLEVLLGGEASSFCGGTLISDQHVLTAAHCVHDKDLKRDYKLLPHLGHLRPPNHLSPFNSNHTFKTEKLCHSKRYPQDMERPKFDLAIIKLDKKVKFNKFIQPACLPLRHKNVLANQAFAIGLGAMELDQFGSVVKRAAGLQVLPVKETECSNGDRDELKICFTDRDPNYVGDTCSGDSGGGIFKLIDGRLTVIGITSYGPVTCKRGIKGKSVNTKLVRLIEEIDSLLKECA